MREKKTKKQKKRKEYKIIDKNDMGDRNYKKS